MAGSKETWRDAVQASSNWADVLKKATRREEAALVLGRAAEIKRRATARRIPEEARR